MKTMRALLLMISLVCLFHSVYAHDKTIPFSELPKKAQVFFKSHFAHAEVAVVKAETEYLFQKEYKLILKDGSEIKFGGDGNWLKVEMKNKAVPIALIPTAILRYLHKSFPNTFITEIKKTRSGYDVEISNGLDLEFNKQGDFLRVDD